MPSLIEFDRELHRRISKADLIAEVRARIPSMRHSIKHELDYARKNASVELQYHLPGAPIMSIYYKRGRYWLLVKEAA